MSFERYFKWSSYCLIASGFAAISATGALDYLSLSLYGAALVASWFVDTARLRKRISTWVMNSIALAYLPLYAADYFLLSRSFVLSTVHFVLFIAAVKLLSRSTDRDYVYLYFISFAQVLAASTLTIDITFGLTLLTFLVSSVSTLILFEMKRSSARAQSGGRVRPLVVQEKVRGTAYELFSGFPALPLLSLCVAMTVGILVFAVPIFFLMPRVTLGIYSRPSGRTHMISGFSETVELGEIGAIKLSDEIVMRVKLEDAPAEMLGSLKWRGIALEHYDGRSWSRTLRGRERLAPRGRFYKLEESTRSMLVLNQTFVLEALSTNVVFVSNRALAVSDNLAFLERDRAGNLFTRRHPYQRMRYTAVSDLTQPDPALIPTIPAEIPGELRGPYLQVPEVDPRIGELAIEWTRSQSHPFRKAQALERRLKTDYGYSLDLKGTPNARDPLAVFLFEVRAGHCEYFASAMTIMLRQLGVPARLVNGFRAGEYNNLGNSWTVRQYDAHSWVEAYFEPYGWVEFDPTPPDPQHFRPMLLKLVSNLMDALDLWWFEEVVNYDPLKQVRLVRSTRIRLLELQQQIQLFMSRWHRRIRSQMDTLDFGRGLSIEALSAAALLSLTAIGLILLLRITGRSRLSYRVRRAVLRKDHRYVITSLYREAQEMMEARGIRRTMDQTPLEFARSLDRPILATPLRTFTEAYNRVRFGAQHSEADITLLAGLLDRLKLALRTGAKKTRS